MNQSKTHARNLMFTFTNDIGVNSKASVYYLLPIFLGVLLLLVISFQAVFAQTTPGLTTYKDPNGKFTIQYPAGQWKVNPATNRFEVISVEFAKIANDDNPASANDNPAYVRIATKSNEQLASFSVDTLGIQQLAKTLAETGSETKSMVEDVNCKKYVIDGHKSCSYVYTTDNTNDPSQKLVVETIMTKSPSKDLYILAYTATTDNFDADLPAANQIINSMHFTK
jgi:hypothetical protein